MYIEAYVYIAYFLLIIEIKERSVAIVEIISLTNYKNLDDK